MNKKATFSCVKDYDEQGEHLGEQPVRRVVPACDLDSISLGDKNQPFQSSQVSPFPSVQTINMPFSIIIIGCTVHTLQDYRRTSLESQDKPSTKT